MGMDPRVFKCVRSLFATMLLVGAATVAVGMLAIRPDTTAGHHRASLSLDAPDPERAVLQERLEREVLPLLSLHCMWCHGEEKDRGGVRFHELNTIDAATEQLETLLRAHELVELDQMPPRDAPGPSREERDTLMRWISDLQRYVDATEPIDPGWFSVRRLNNDEYRLTMRDLLRVDPDDIDVARDLPPDNIGYGFNTVGDALTVSPLHIDAYIDAAAEALRIGLGPVVAINTEPQRLLPLESSGGSRELQGGGRFLFSASSVRAIHHTSVPSIYEFRVQAYGTRGGDELPKLSLRIDAQEIAQWEIEATDPASPQRLTVRHFLESGPHEVTAHFLNDYYEKGVADRNLAIVAIEIAGPLDAEDVQRGPAYEEIFTFEPGSTMASQRNAASKVLRSFGDRAFRRPMTDAEAKSLMQLYDDMREAGDGYEAAVRVAMQAMLVSPSFLYMSAGLEAHSTQSVPGGQLTPHVLTGFELASRLSYFLWSSMPDAELTRLASLDLLSEPRVLEAQIDRMLEDPKADAFIEGFAGQWLLLRNLQDLDIDRQRFTSYDESLMNSMIAEPLHFFADMVRRNRPLSDLIGARDTFVDERLAAHYGIEGVRGDRMRRVHLASDSPRGGVLTMGAVLTVTSNPTRTSPVKRGYFVLDQLLGSPPPPPPDDVPPLEVAAAELGREVSLRDQLKAHLLNATCVSCHAQMDPIGLSMEQFDAIGRWREAYESGPIDVSANLPDGRTFEGAQGLKQVLASREAQLTENLTRRMMIYALGRGLESFDRPSVVAIMEETTARGGGMADLIKAIATSKAFTTCRSRTEQP